MSLTEKQIRFCEEYLIDLNGTQAAIRSGYSSKTANEQAARLLANVSIQNYLVERRKQIAGALNITQERVLKEYAKLAFSDTRKYFDDNGRLINIPDLDDNAAAALAGFDIMEEKGGNGEGQQVVLGYVKKIKLWDKVKALDSLGKHLGLFEGTSQLSGKKITVTISE